MHRRWLIAVIGGIAVAFGGCGDGGGDAADERAAEPVGVPIPEITTPRGFPSIIASAYGSTEVKRRPKRIVTVGRTEHDIVLALGEQPIAVTEWFGDQPYATWPWARKYLGDSKPVVLHTDRGFEWDKIAALKPDLIMAGNAGLTQEEYDRFSRIAPTLGPDQATSNGFSAFWNSLTPVVGAALGRIDQADAYVVDVMKRFAQMARAYPEFARKTVTIARLTEDGTIEANPAEVDTEPLTMLGFVVNPGVSKMTQPSVNDLVEVPKSKIEVLDADVAVLLLDRPEDITRWRQIPGFDELPVVRDGRTLYADPTLSAAIRFMTPLSLRYVASHLPAPLAQAVAGKASQSAPGSEGT